MGVGEWNRSVMLANRCDFVHQIVSKNSNVPMCSW